MQNLLLPLALAVFLGNCAWAQLPVANDSNISPSTHIANNIDELSLDVALEWAMRANPDIAIAVREVQAIEGSVRQAGIMPNPSLETLIEDTDQATRTTTVQLNIPIELAGKRGARVNVAELARDTASLELIGKQAEVRAVVVAAFYELITAQERQLLALTSAELAQRATSFAAKRVSAGKVSPVEETRARVAEATVRAESILAASELQNARLRLAATWGSSQADFGRAIVVKSMDVPALPTLDDLLRRLQQSPNLLHAQIAVEYRQALARVERSRQTPDIVINIGAKRDEQLGRNQALLGVAVPIPLFDRNQGNVLEAARRVDKARDELTATRLRLTTELAQAHGRLSAARQEVDLLRQEILPGAQSAYDATTKGFELGKFNFIEVLDAQRTYFLAKAQYIRALAETYRATVDIDRLLGTPYQPSLAP